VAGKGDRMMNMVQRKYINAKMISVATVPGIRVGEGDGEYWSG
jgi:hypothetical protein